MKVHCDVRRHYPPRPRAGRQCPQGHARSVGRPGVKTLRAVVSVPQPIQQAKDYGTQTNFRTA